MLDAFQQWGLGLMGPTAWLVVWTLIKIIAVVLPLMGCVAYLTLWERKAIGWTQVRPGPNRVGPWGLLTPIADAVKLVFKEIIRPTAANKGLFFLGPVMTIMPALAAWAVVPFGPDVVLANVNAGLLTYPVLQAADILIHRAVKVPVGKDQEQNLEMARNFAERFNHRYGETFPLPYAFNYNSELVKILGLDGEGKMSKSENQMTTLFLADTDDLIRKKVMKAKTDQGPLTPSAAKPDYIQNLFTLMGLVSSADTVQKFEDDFNNSSEGNCIIRYGDMKKQLAEDMVNFINPIRSQAADLQNNKAHLLKIIQQGADKARASASVTLSMVRKTIGMDYL